MNIMIGTGIALVAIALVAIALYAIHSIGKSLKELTDIVDYWGS